MLNEDEMCDAVVMVFCQEAGLLGAMMAAKVIEELGLHD